jgi:C4-dicarboxylate-specific signal transduction histidine kinase
LDLEKLEAARAQITHASKMSALGEMAGGVAHEINNPLATIQLLVGQIDKLLKEAPIDKERLGQKIEKTQQTIRRISTIVHGLRVFCGNGSEERPEAVSLGALASDSLSLCEQKFRNYGITLSCDFHAPAAAIECRPSEISQVIINLLNNSFDAVSSQPEKWVKLELAEENEFVELSVTDSGPGIAREIADKMFDPFFSTKGIGKGSGMGLSVAKGIVEAQRGRLFLAQDFPNTRFVIRFPKYLARQAS